MSTKQFLLPLVLLAVVVITLLGLSVFFVAPNIQNDLAKEVRNELTKYSIPANITLSGRDVTLSGTVDALETKKKASLITEKVCGIRFVNNQLLTAKPENIALLSNSPSNAKIEKKISTAPKNINKQRTTDKKGNDNNLATSTKSADLKIASSQKPDSTPVNSPKKTAIPITEKKSNVLSYDAMLAAMTAYNAKKKGRNPKKSQTIKVQFENDTHKILPESHEALNKWTSHFKRSNKILIQITVTAENLTQAMARAKTINTYFIDQGIEASRIETESKKGTSAVYFIEKPL